LAAVKFELLEWAQSQSLGARGADSMRLYRGLKNSSSSQLLKSCGFSQGAIILKIDHGFSGARGHRSAPVRQTIQAAERFVLRRDSLFYLKRGDIILYQRKSCSHPG
jgi:hypothetical protein